jgi:hypothetical protein
MVEIDTIVRHRCELRLDRRAQRYQGALEVELTLPSPQTRIPFVVSTGVVGRADADLGGEHLAAAHYWSEAAANLVIQEFSQALPAGEVRLVLPLTGELTPRVLALMEGDGDPSLLPHLATARDIEWEISASEAHGAGRATFSSAAG